MTSGSLDWRPDPTGRHELRYFRGEEATPWVRDGEVRSIDPFGAGNTGTPAPQPGPGWPEQAYPPGGIPTPYASVPPTMGGPAACSPVPMPLAAPPGAFPPASYGPYYPGGPYPGQYLPIPVPTPSHRRRWIALAAVVCVAAAGVGVFFGTRSSSPPSGPNAYSAGSISTTDTAAHFAARFPHSPQLENPAPQLVDGSGVTATYHFAEDDASHILVFEADISVPIPPDQVEPGLLGVLAGFVGQDTTVTVQQDRSTSFRGNQARMALLSTPDGPFDLLFFFNGNVRLYGLLAPHGATFDTLEESFQIVG